MFLGVHKVGTHDKPPRMSAGRQPRLGLKPGSLDQKCSTSTIKGNHTFHWSGRMMLAFFVIPSPTLASLHSSRPIATWLISLCSLSTISQQNIIVIHIFSAFKIEQGNYKMHRKHWVLACSVEHFFPLTKTSFFQNLSKNELPWWK